MLHKAGDTLSEVLLAACVVIALLSAVACSGSPLSVSPELSTASLESVTSTALPLQTRFPPPNLRFGRITREEGLSSNVVRCILQDSRGFLWVGTQDGLNRYDGQGFTVYRHDPDDPTSLRDDFIESLYEDRSGVLWIGTQDGWLERYDRGSDGFAHHQVSSHVFAMHEDQEGLFWVGSKAPGLLRVDRDTGATEVVWSGRDFTSIIEDRAGTLWAVSPEEGIGRYDGAQDRFVPLEDSTSAYVMVEDELGELWLGTSGRGLGRFDRESQSFRYLLHEAGDPDSLSADSVSSLHVDAAGRLWIGTYGSGLDRFDRETGRFAHYRNDPGDPHSLSADSVTTIYTDRSGALWVGHEAGGGLSKLPSGAERFGHYRHVPGDPHGLTGEVVTSLYEDQEGSLWIGTFSGLDAWDRRTGQWRNYQHDTDDPGSLAHDSVRSVYVDNANVLWVGTEGGLDRYDRRNQRFIHYTGSPVVMWMQQGPSGRFWLATKGGLYELEREADVLTFLSKGYAWKIMVHEDRSGVVWVGSSGDGLDCYDPSSGEWRHYANEPDDPHSLSNDFVESIHEDATGRLWLGTRAGLNRFVAETETFVRYWVRDGLPHNAVVGILEDGQGTLWLATGGGLSRFDPTTGIFQNYHAGDGVQADSFWRNSYHQSPAGEMFFGGENGFNAFFPQQIASNAYVPPVFITAVSVFNQVVQRNLPADQPLELAYSDNFLSFEFAALDYNNPEKNRYAYKMRGIDADWVQAGTRRHADYPNLRPANYVFRVKGSNGDGVWNEEGASIRIIIAPPFWGTWWFRASIALALMGMAAAGYWWRVRSVEARSRELENQVEERTAELRWETEQRLQVEEALRQSEMEKAVASERSRLARELHDAVTQTLFSASLIAEVLPRVWERDPEMGRQQLAEVRVLARGALAEMRALLMELRPETLLRARMDDLLSQLGRALTGRTGVPVSVSADAQCQLPEPIHVALYRIAQEALNNAAKHAEAKQVEVSFRCQPGQAELSISDDGRGFDVANIPPGRLGLEIMRERAEAIGAQMEIESAVGRGTVVRVVWTDGE